jgi:hypothetical protein
MMDPEDVGKILGIAAGIDKRIVGKADIISWGRALDGLDPRECAEAVEAHFADPATCDRYLVVGHVIGRVQARHRQAAEQRKNDRQQLALEAAREETTRTPHEWYLEAKRLVEEKRRELGYITDEPEGETA